MECGMLTESLAFKIGNLPTARGNLGRQGQNVDCSRGHHRIEKRQ